MFFSVYRSFTSLTSYRTNPYVRSLMKQSRRRRRVQRRKSFSSASKFRFVSTDSVNDSASPLVLHNRHKANRVVCNIILGRRAWKAERIKWAEPETPGAEWTVQTGDSLIYHFVFKIVLYWFINDNNICWCIPHWWQIHQKSDKCVNI